MRKKNENSLKEALDLWVNNNSFRKKKIQQAKVEEMWEEIAGAVIARKTTKVWLNEGDLYIAVDSAVVRQELFYHQTNILQRFNESFGREVIKKVILL